MVKSLAKLLLDLEPVLGPRVSTPNSGWSSTSLIFSSSSLSPSTPYLASQVTLPLVTRNAGKMQMPLGGLWQGLRLHS